MRLRSYDADEDDERSPNNGMSLQLRVTARRSSKRLRDVCGGGLVDIKRKLKQDLGVPVVDCPLPCNGARVQPDSAQVGGIRLEDGVSVTSLDSEQTLSVNGVQALETTAQRSSTLPGVQQPQRFKCDPGACATLGTVKNLEPSPAKADMRETAGVLGAPPGAMTSSTADGARCQAPHLTNAPVLDTATAAAVSDGPDQKAHVGCSDAEPHQAHDGAGRSHPVGGTIAGQPQATQAPRTAACNRLPGLRTLPKGPGHLGLYLRAGQGPLPPRLRSGGDTTAAGGKSGLGLGAALGVVSPGVPGRFKQQPQMSERPVLLPQSVAAAAPPVAVQDGSGRVQATPLVAAGLAGAAAETGGDGAQGGRDTAAGANGAATAGTSGGSAPKPVGPTVAGAAAAAGGGRTQGAPHATAGTTTATAGTSAPGARLAPKAPLAAPPAAVKGAAAAACRAPGFGRSGPLGPTARGRCRSLMEFDDWLQWLHRGKERTAGLGQGQGRERAAGSVMSTGERGLLVSVDGRDGVRDNDREGDRDSETESEGGASSSPSSGDTDDHSSGCGSDRDSEDGSCSTYGVTLEEPQEEEDGEDTETERESCGAGGAAGTCTAAARGTDHVAAATCQAARATAAAGAGAAAVAGGRGALKRPRPQRGTAYGPPWMLVPRSGRALRFGAGAASCLWPHLMSDPGACKTRLPVTLHVVDLQGHCTPMQGYMRRDNDVGSQMVLRGFPRWPLVPGTPWNALLQIGPHPSGDGALVQLAGPYLRVQYSLRTGKVPPEVPQEEEALKGGGDGGGGDRHVRGVGSCGGNGGGGGGGASSAAVRTLRVRLRKRLFRRSFLLDLPPGTAQLVFGHLVEAHGLQEGRGALGEQEEVRRGAAAAPGAVGTAWAAEAEAPGPGAGDGAAAAGGDGGSGPQCRGAIPFKVLQITLIAEAWPESKFQVELRCRFPGVFGLPYSACRARAILGTGAMGPIVLYGGQAGDILELWQKPGGRPEEFVCHVVRMDGKGVGGAAAQGRRQG